MYTISHKISKAEGSYLHQEHTISKVKVAMSARNHLSAEVKNERTSRVVLLESSASVSFWCLSGLGGSWRFPKNLALNSKACQKYCESGVRSDVVGRCPQMAWALSSLPTGN